MGLYQKGDEASFEVIYQRYSNRVLSYLLKKVKSDKTAQDLTQEVFLKLHRSRSQYNGLLPLAPWIFSISRSIFLDFTKKKSLEVATPPEEFDGLQAVPIAINNEPLELLDILPEEQRATISLRIVDEATFDEIALKLSTSPENARQIFSRGIRKLKSSFGKRE